MEGKREKGESRFDFSITHIFNKFVQEPYGTFNTKNFSKIFGKIWVVFKLCSFIQVLACMNKTLSVRLRGLKTKDESSWVIPKVVTVANESVCLQELFITKFKSQISFTKVVITRAGRL